MRPGDKDRFIELLTHGLSINPALSDEDCDLLIDKIVEYLELNLEKDIWAYRDGNKICYDYKFIPGEIYATIDNTSIIFRTTDSEVFQKKVAGIFVLGFINFLDSMAEYIKEEESNE